MNIGISLAFLAAGIILTIFGVNEMNSLESEISRMMTGISTDRSIWITVSGVAITALGLSFLVPGLRKKMIAWM